MSIIIQTGHEASSSEALMKLLYSRGLKKPILSNVQQLSGHKIANTLDKVISKQQSIGNSKLTENIVVDFLLANIDQDDWGWADSKNLPALSYWQSFEPNTRFSLVFDHPKKMLSQFTERDVTIETVDSLMEEWLLYHKSMLSFFDTHSDSCLLLEGDFSIKQVVKTKELFKSISSSLILKSGWQPDTNSATDSNIIESSNNIAYEAMIEEVVKNYPEVVNIFNSLLTKADLKGSKAIYKTKRLEMGTLVTAIANINKLKIDLDNKNKIINNLQEEQKITENLKIDNESLKSSLCIAQETIKKLYDENDFIKNKISSFEIINQRNKELKTDNDTLITALHTLQESIERMTFKNESIKISDESSPLNNKILEKENSWLVSELHNTQNLLERKCISIQKSENHAIEPSKESTIISKSVAVYHTPESRVKNEFSYRLGAALVRTKTIKGILSLPVTVTREYGDYLQVKKELEGLPPLDKEVDISQAEKVKSHLSYRVGSTVIQSLKSPKKLIMLPVNISKEVLDFKK